MAGKMSRSDRAKQFMPFAALRGYEQMVKNCKVIPCEKKELTEEQAQNLSDKVSKIKKGDIVKVQYYKDNGYTFIEGIVTFIDFAIKKISIIKTEISFNEIISIEFSN